MFIGIGIGVGQSLGAPQDPLAPFAASGTIGVHYSTDAVTRDAQGRVTAMRNLGGFGAALDAPVVGAALVQQGATVVFPADSATYVETPVVLDLVGVRLMWLMDPELVIQGTRIFGHFGDLQSFINVTQNEVGRTMVLNIAGQPGMPLNPRLVWPTGLSVYELDVGATEQRLLINGVEFGYRAGALVTPTFPISRIGAGNAATLPFAGRLGEIIAPIQGRPDSTAANAAARARLMEKRALG